MKSINQNTLAGKDQSLHPSYQTQESDTVVRVHRHEKDFLIVTNATVQDERLSWEARGLLVYLLSLPPNWEIRVSHLQKQGSAGRDALRRMLRELQKFGYASGVGRESQERSEHGRFNQTEIRVFESPALNPLYFQAESPSPENPSTVDQPLAVSPSTDLPSPENLSTYKEHSPQKTDSTNNTHTTSAARTTPTAFKSANAGVSVNSSKSGFSFEERKAHAAANGLGGGWLNNSRDGRFDEMIADAIERSKPEVLAQTRSTPPDNRTSKFAAAALIQSIVDSYPDSNPDTEIAGLNVSDETRAWLLERTWVPANRKPAAVIARAATDEEAA